MTYDRELFKKLDTSIITKVKIGNGERITARGKGTMSIESLSGQKLISEVLFVPDIDRNLLSVGQLLEKDYEVFFRKKCCTIIDPEGREVFRIKMKGKSFVLDMLEQEQTFVAQRDNNTMLWHKRLGHFHHNVVLFMKKTQM
ncbi:hypothetical protein MANES_01G103601v8 [Manihot esculenta]|uniref:Sodium/hydrogen exchanger n=1 Tax=Manihot esculenta TaxID=3983 RepID=A0A2C9WMW8_MANES|nr:hypothetical protein MANES_01G103601v8 [Manihot esculenta]